jgi:membrane protein DedA with SNARE-associated domain
MKALFAPLLTWYLASLKQGGFLLVALLMAIESSIVPLPSEVVIPPAAHLAWTEGISFLGVHWQGWSAQIGLVLAGAVGSWIGATMMYWASRWAGRPLVLRYGKYFFVPAHKVEGAERWAAAYGSFGIFASRLLPVVRHLIGIPAGIVRLDYGQFSLYTLLGSALWSAVLCWLGVQVGAEINHGQMHRVTFWLVGFLLLLGALYYLFVHRQMRSATASDA